MSAYENERWWAADQTAAFLSVDRDTCRRAFYGEPLSLVSEVVGWVRSQEHEPNYDPEKLIEGWAREVGAGVFDEERRGKSNFTHVGEVVADEFLHLASKRPELEYELEYRLYLICVQLEEAKVGRQLITSELEQFTRRFYAPSYRRDLQKIPQRLWDELYLDLEQENPRTRRKRPPRRKLG